MKSFNVIPLLFVAFSLSSSSSFSTTTSTEFPPAIDATLLPATVSGNTECSAASSNTTFGLTFISYGNWTALPEQGENPIQHLESISFAVTNAANAVSTICAFSLGSTLKQKDVGLADAEAAWQACADRKDTDGKHRFTIATGAAFGLVGRTLSLNQTWFCHDDAGRLVAFTGVARAMLNMTCSESEVSGYHLQNCTSPDLALPVTLL